MNLSLMGISVFLARYENEKFELLDAKNIIHDLKWSKRKHLKVFLKQLCLQCAAEAINDGATRINWNFSHPLAFTEPDRGRFERIWNEVGSDCVRATGLPQQVVTPAQSESVVTAKFFATKLQNQYATGGFTTGAVCIDIGGETSDISIWQNDALYWQTSLRFAGRHIFLNLLKENPDFLKHFGANDGDIDLLKNASEDEDEKFYAHADALIRDKGQVWLGQLTDLSNEDGTVQPIQPFIQLISLGVAGLFYYVGLLLQSLSLSTADFKPEIPSIYIGGNGSKILDWMAEGSFNHDTIASLCRKHLKHIIREASEFRSDNERGIEISQEPKMEAAYGLVVPGPKLRLNQARLDILAGETFIEDGKRNEWTEFLTDDRLGNRLSVSENNLEKISKLHRKFQ